MWTFNLAKTLQFRPSSDLFENSVISTIIWLVRKFSIYYSLCTIKFITVMVRNDHLNDQFIKCANKE